MMLIEKQRICPRKDVVENLPDSVADSRDGSGSSEETSGGPEEGKRVVGGEHQSL